MECGTSIFEVIISRFHVAVFATTSWCEVFDSRTVILWLELEIWNCEKMKVSFDYRVCGVVDTWLKV